MQKQNLLCEGNQKVKLWKLRISFVGVSGTVIRGMNVFLNGRRNLSKAVNKDDMWTPYRKTMAGLEASPIFLWTTGYFGYNKQVF